MKFLLWYFEPLECRKDFFEWIQFRIVLEEKKKEMKIENNEKIKNEDWKEIS